MSEEEFEKMCSQQPDEEFWYELETDAEAYERMTWKEQEADRLYQTATKGESNQ